MLDPQVVSETLETSAPAPIEGADTPESALAPSQTETASPPTPPAEQPKAETPAPSIKDMLANVPLRQLLADHPHLNNEFQSYLSKRVQRELTRSQRTALRAQADEALAEDADPYQAAKVLKTVRSTVLDQAEEPDEDAPLHLRPEWQQQEAEARPVLARLTSKHADLYAQVYAAQGKAEMDRRYMAGPAAFADWLDDQIDELRAAKAKQSASAMAEALAAERTAAALKQTPMMPTGGVGAGAETERDFLRRFGDGELEFSDENVARVLKLTGQRL